MSNYSVFFTTVSSTVEPDDKEGPDHDDHGEESDP
jgi:hypothetical protein